jgi:hypothetical protein
LTALLLRLHGVVKSNKVPRGRKKNLFMIEKETSRRAHGDHGVATELPYRCNAFYGVSICNCLCSDCTSTAFFALPLRFHGAKTALSWRSHCAKIVLHIPAILNSRVPAAPVCKHAGNITACSRSSSKDIYMQTRSIY